MKVHVVIPVFGEAENVAGLLAEIDALPPELRAELVVDFIDDSRDDATVAAVRASAPAHPDLDVRCLHRTGVDRTGGLAGAVLVGMGRARADGADAVLVMDGDGQHPPSTIPSMLAALDLPRSRDLVVASRYTAGGSREGLDGPWRRLVSQGATWVAKSLFPFRLRGVTDPMTGFFVVRLDRLDLDRIDAVGFKILLEVLVRTPLGVGEVPVAFRNRNAGESKATAARGAEYVRQLIRLRLSTPPWSSDRPPDAAYDVPRPA